MSTPSMVREEQEDYSREEQIFQDCERKEKFSSTGSEGPYLLCILGVQVFQGCVRARTQVSPFFVGVFKIFEQFGAPCFIVQRFLQFSGAMRLLDLFSCGDPTAQSRDQTALLEVPRASRASCRGRPPAGA